MLIGAITAIVITMILANFVVPRGTIVGKCHSVTCRHNLGGSCSRRQIDIYDNRGIGLCLWHTSTMEERLVEPFNSGKAIGKINGEIALTDKLKKAIEEDADTKAIQNPKEFSKWLRRHKAC